MPTASWVNCNQANSLGHVFDHRPHLVSIAEIERRTRLRFFAAQPDRQALVVARASELTAGFTVLVFAQLFNAFNARSETVSAFRHLFANHWLWGSVALSAALLVAVVHLEPLNTAFGMRPLSLDQWLACLAMGSIVLWFAELRKWTLRRVKS